MGRNQEVYFDDITVSLLMDYMSYLSNELKKRKYNTTLFDYDFGDYV